MLATELLGMLLLKFGFHVLSEQLSARKEMLSVPDDVILLSLESVEVKLLLSLDIIDDEDSSSL